jgi:hypothetical protein
VPERNDQLIFTDIGFVFVINMVLNALWVFIYLSNSTLGFTLSFIEILLLLSSCFFMMMKTSRGGDLNWTEFISMKVGFSIYAGWVTSATILNLVYMLKS